LSSLRIDEGGDFALTLLGQEIITTTDMGLIDEYIRYTTLVSLLLQVILDIVALSILEFIELYNFGRRIGVFFSEKSLGLLAIRAPRLGEYHDLVIID